MNPYNQRRSLENLAARCSKIQGHSPGKFTQLTYNNAMSVSINDFHSIAQFKEYRNILDAGHDLEYDFLKYTEEYLRWIVPAHIK